jgi:hypothetical protein
VPVLPAAPDQCGVIAAGRADDLVRADDSPVPGAPPIRFALVSALRGRCPCVRAARSLLKKVSILLASGITCVMQGFESGDRKLLDAAAVTGHLIPEGGMFAFLAAHRAEVFPMRTIRICSPRRGWAGPRSRPRRWPRC